MIITVKQRIFGILIKLRIRFYGKKFTKWNDELIMFLYLTC